MFINTITYKTAKLNMINKGTRKMVPETNFILYYGQKDYLFNNVFGEEIRKQEQTCEKSTYLKRDDRTGKPNTKNNREYLGFEPGWSWRFCDKTMLEHIASGRIYIKGGKLKFMQFIKGVKVSNFINNQGRAGEYPTQKPYKLLERVICLSTL